MRSRRINKWINFFSALLFLLLFSGAAFKSYSSKTSKLNCATAHLESCYHPKSSSSRGGTMHQYGYYVRRHSIFGTAFRWDVELIIVHSDYNVLAEEHKLHLWNTKSKSQLLGSILLVKTLSTDSQVVLANSIRNGESVWVRF